MNWMVPNINKVFMEILFLQLELVYYCILAFGVWVTLSGSGMCRTTITAGTLEIFEEI